MTSEPEKRASDDRPWLGPEANAVLERLIAEGRIRTVLEFGSGGSTVFFAERVDRVVSVEHNPRWHRRTVQGLQSRRLRNAKVVLAAATQSSPHQIYRGRDGRYYRNYVKAGTAAARREFRGSVDCVLVDGRARVACAFASLRYVRPGGVLIVDDAERSSYRPIEDRLQEEGWTRVRTRCRKNCTDFWFRPQAEPVKAAETVDVLVVSSNRSRGRFNDLLHRGFFAACPLRVAWYGRGETGPIAYDPVRPLREAVATLRPKLVLINMQKRVHPWLPASEIRALRVPTAVVEVDYCYSGHHGKGRPRQYSASDQWYREADIGHLFLRHRVDVERSNFPARSWLPFSNDPEIFCPGGEKPFGVGFAGSIRPEFLYPARRAAIAALEGLIETRIRQLSGVPYAEFLRSCRLGLTCACQFGYDNAKHVQIPASGSLLLTDGSRGTAELLPDPDMYVRYRSDASDIREQVTRLLHDPEQVKERAALAAAHCREHHTHERRWAQLLETMALEGGSSEANHPAKTIGTTGDTGSTGES